MMQNKVRNKLIIGLTGGSGAGKTTVSEVFGERGVYVIDADKTAREIVEPGQPALAEIDAAFDGVILPNGTLDRKKLGSIVFSDKEKLAVLNEITHKYISRRIYDIMESVPCEAFLIDAAALFESGIDKKCDVVCAVCADEDVRVRRICARDSLTETAARERVHSQLSNAQYAERCAYVIDNSTTVEAARLRTNEIIDKIFKEFR